MQTDKRAACNCGLEIVVAVDYGGTDGKVYDGHADAVALSDVPWER